MSIDELLVIFQAELALDLMELSRYIEAEKHEAINEFAHKYKVRLHHLNYFDCFELCLIIERNHKDKNHQLLLENADKLLLKLRTLGEN